MVENSREASREAKRAANNPRVLRAAKALEAMMLTGTNSKPVGQLRLSRVVNPVADLSLTNRLRSKSMANKCGTQRNWLSADISQDQLLAPLPDLPKEHVQDQERLLNSSPNQLRK